MQVSPPPDKPVVKQGKESHDMELTHEQRIVAVETLSKDLQRRLDDSGVDLHHGPQPGVGCEVRTEPEGDVWASLTITKGGYLRSGTG